MKKIIPLLLFTQLTQADNWLALKADTQDRLNHALELSESYNSAQSKQGTDFVTVGTGNDCDFRIGTNKIQSAIDSGATEIRIASNDTYEETITITSPITQLTLRGGFANCTDAENNIQSDDPDDYTEISRENGTSGSVFTIDNLPSGLMTTFENLKINGGHGQNITSGGSISLLTIRSDVMLNNTWLTQGTNNASGGGLSIISSNTTVTLNNSMIFANEAVQGGGIYCNDFSSSNNRASIILNQDSSLYSNSTSFQGGGAYLGSGCFLSSFTGSAVANAGIGIFNNSAEHSGGGIYAKDGADVLIYGGRLCNLTGACFGNTHSPASIYANQANVNFLTNSSGGGIYASDSGTSVDIFAGYIYNNESGAAGTGSAGGALAIHNAATLNITRLGFECWNQDRCNLFSGNSGSNGGAIFNNNATVNISHSYFEDNRANSGLALFTTLNGISEIDSSVFNNNGNNGIGDRDDQSVITTRLGAKTTISYSTIADNKAETSVFSVDDTFNSELNIQSSIIHDADSGDVINDTLGTVISHCVMAHETISLTGTNNTTDDPEFIDRTNRDYHLDPIGSPAVDYCTFYPSLLNKDIDFQERGFNNLSVNDHLGTYDLGADEAFVKPFLTVGGDAACDYNTNTQSIQDAVDTGIQEVRIATNGTHNSTVDITSRDVRIRGGYTDCNAANNDLQTTRTNLIVTTGDSGSAIAISGDSQRRSIELDGLNLTGLGRSAVTVFNANVQVSIHNVVMQNTHTVPSDLFPVTLGTFGGGVYISNSNVSLNMIDTLIMQNSALQGGGIYCNGSAANITMSGISGITQNTTAGKGGGAFITNGCQFTMYSGTTNPTALSTAGISANMAEEEGGGIYVSFEGHVILNGHQDCTDTCIGDNTKPVNVNHNKSNNGLSGGERGGGIYMTGTGTQVQVYAVLFSENQSPNGGAIYINDLANLTVARLSQACWNPAKCNYFFKNKALGSGTGGAIQSDQGFINISNAHFEENNAQTGTAIYTFGSNANGLIHSSIFNNNGNQSSADEYVIRAAALSDIDILHSTFADNHIVNTSVFGVASDSQLRLYNSIVHDPMGDVFDLNQGTVIIDCLMTHETGSFTGTHVFLEDPEFTDRDNRDYHLSLDSPAIDVCADNTFGLNTKDIDFNVRGVDDPDVGNINGSFDLGADEAGGSDLIFKNSFEN